MPVYALLLQDGSYYIGKCDNLTKRCTKHARESRRLEHLWQEDLYNRIRTTGGWESVVVSEISDVSGEAAAALEADLIKQYYGTEGCLNGKRERSDNPGAVRMRAYYEENREKWNAYNREKQRQRRAALAAGEL